MVTCRIPLKYEKKLTTLVRANGGEVVSSEQVKEPRGMRGHTSTTRAVRPPSPKPQRQSSSSSAPVVAPVKAPLRVGQDIQIIKGKSGVRCGTIIRFYTVNGSR